MILGIGQKFTIYFSEKITWILSSLWRISAREGVRQMGYILEKMNKCVVKMVIFEES